MTRTSEVMEFGVLTYTFCNLPTQAKPGFGQIWTSNKAQVVKKTV